MESNRWIRPSSEILLNLRGKLNCFSVPAHFYSPIFFRNRASVSFLSPSHCHPGSVTVANVPISLYQIAQTSFSGAYTYLP